MALSADHSSLPRERAEGNPPDPTPRFGHLLAEAWREINDESHHVKSRTDVERYVRLGWAGQCARLIGYRLLDVPESNPPDLAATWRMSLGTMVHELLQEAVIHAFPGAEVEKVVGAESDEVFGFPVSGRTDLFVIEASGIEHGDEGDIGTKRTAVEIKSINGFGFKKAVGARGVPEGPRGSALYQAALNGRAHNADEVVIVYLSLECLSDRELESLVKKTGGEPVDIRKFVAEWSWPMAELDAMVDAELKRLTKIVGMVNDDTLPPRSVPHEMPARARVTDATKGTWTLEADGNIVEAGSYWGCSYCGHQDQCAKDGAS